MQLASQQRAATATSSSQQSALQYIAVHSVPSTAPGQTSGRPHLPDVSRLRFGAMESSHSLEAAQASLESLTSTVPQTTATVLTITTEAAPQSSLGMVGGLFIGIFTVIPSLLYWVVSFVTLTLPTWLFTFLSTSLTFTMNMTTLLLTLFAFASTVA
ncbi:hypothetical protein KC316_g7167, partial [Hortaea werneckii]